MNTAPLGIDPEKLAKANRYANLLRNKAKRQYAFAYLSYLRNGGYGNEPEHTGLSYMGAQAVRLELTQMNLWSN